MEKTNLGTRKWTAILLAIALVFSVLPGVATPAYAADSVDITSQFVDLNFRAAVYDQIGKTSPAAILASDVDDEKNLSIDHKAIRDLTGIANFKNLETLSIRANLLTTLPALPSSLETLDCTANLLTTLPALPSTLKYLYCFNNRLTTLPDLPSSLETLLCENNRLTALPALPDSLFSLNCQNNKLTSLPALPDGMAYLSCGDNQLTSLPSMPPSMNSLECQNNRLTALDVSKASLYGLNCAYNYMTGPEQVIGFSKASWNGTTYQFYPQVPLYALNVTNGTGGGTYIAEAPVTITADPAPAGQRFKQWTITPAVTFTDGTSAASPTAKFTMPEQAVTAAATYEPIPKDVIVDIQKDKEGRPILTADPTPATPLQLAEMAGKAITIADKAWTGKKIQSGLTIKASYVLSGKVVTKTLRAGVDYTVTKTGANKNIGKATVTITGKAGSAFAGVKSLSFKIVPKKPSALKLKAGAKSMTVSWKKNSKAQKITTYKVAYRIKGTAKWKTKTVKVKLTGKDAKTQTASLTLKQLKAKKTYEVRVYAYKGAYKGAATSIKRVKTK